MLNLQVGKLCTVNLNNERSMLVLIIEQVVHTPHLHSYACLDRHDRMGYLWDRGQHSKERTAINTVTEMIGGDNVTVRRKD